MNRLVLIVLVCLVLLLGLSWWKIRSLQTTSHDYEQLYKAEKKKAVSFKDKQNKWRSRAEAADLSNSTLKDLIKNDDKHFKAWAGKFEGLNKKLKNLENLTSLNTNNLIHFSSQLKDTVYVRTVDSVRVPAKNFVWADTTGYNTFSGTIVDDSIIGRLSVKDTLEIVTYWKRPWFLGKKKYETEVRSSNPNTKPVITESVVTRKKKGKFLGIF